MIELNPISRIQRTPDKLFPLLLPSINVSQYKFQKATLLDIDNILNYLHQPNRAKNQPYAFGFRSFVNFSELLMFHFEIIQFFCRQMP